MLNTSAKVAFQNFEQTFEYLLRLARKERISILTLITALSGKGKMLMLIILSLGFSQIPVVAMFVGLIIAYLGIRVAIGKNFIVMPKYFLQFKIPSYFIITFCGQILKLIKYTENWSKPRYQSDTKTAVISRLSGLMIAFIGICIACSPPIPLTGFLASIAVVLIVIGLLNCDMIFIFLGYIFAILYAIVVGFLLRYCSFTQIYEWIKSFINWL